MSQTVAERLVPVVEAAIEYNGSEKFDFGGKGLSFIHAAFTELLECRSLLQHSYAFAFFRYPAFEDVRRSRSRAARREQEKQSFEHKQSQLEMMTEQMSDIVARKHIRATQMQVMFLTNGACEKRSELSSFMLTVLKDQRKEAKDDAERSKLEKKKKTAVNRVPSEVLSSAFGPYGFGFPQYHHPRDDIPEHLQSLLDTAQFARTASIPGVDSDDEDDDLIVSNRGRWGRSEDDEVQQALQESMQAYLRGRSEASSSEPRWESWSCSICTYMNGGGQRCAMCGSARV